MASIIYTAKRSLIDSHSAETEYSFEVALNKFERSPKREKETSASLSGNRFTVLHRIDMFFEVSTVPIKDISLIYQMREFLDSVAAGESFIIDAFGTELQPYQQKVVEIDGDYSESMVDISGYYAFSFKVLEI